MRNFQCMVSSCGKSYGSENSLNQHVKLKHKDFWVSLRNREMHMNKAESMYFDKGLNGDENGHGQMFRD